MPPTGSRWTALIDDLVAGTWRSPLTGKVFPPAPFGRIVIEEDLSGQEADMVASIGFEPPFAIVSDEHTHPAMGERIARALSAVGPVTEIVLDHPHADMAMVEKLRRTLPDGASVVAVGSGTINDICKHATFLDGRPYCVFGTAGSMNGYTSSTASVTLESGLKVSRSSQIPKGVFIDLGVCAAAPAYLNAAGFGDCMCRTVAQVDWWMAHRLLGERYRHEPYLIQIPDEAIMHAQAEGIARGDVEAVGALMRVLILCGIGVCFTGVSNHGSMGEHQISHYLDCFAGDRHPGTIHGQQVGVASLTMARVQGTLLQRQSPPELKPTVVDEADMIARMGEATARDCLVEYRKKALGEAGAEALNTRLAKIWPELKEECLEVFVPAESLEELLQAASGATTAKALGFPLPFYREAVCHAHEMRNRFSFADIAASTGDLARIAAAEV